MTSSTASDQSPATRNAFRVKPSTIVFVATNAMLWAMALLAFLRFGALHLSAEDDPKAERLLPDEISKSITLAPPGETVDATFKISNWFDEDVRILGCKMGCDGAVASTLPLVIPAGETRDFTLTIWSSRVGGGGSDAALKLPFILFTNSPSQPRVHLSVIGRRAVERDVAEPAK